jgi:putative intracellular protease/amidase
MKILMVLTSHGELGDTGDKTGVWLEEFAAPYYAFKDAGVSVTLASPKGGPPPIDPKSDLPSAPTPATERFSKDDAVKLALSHTRPLSQCKAEDFNAVFYPGGHGPLWDLAENPLSIALLERFNELKKPIGAVCHASGVLRHVKGRDNLPLVRNRRVTGFSNSEEDAVGLTDIVPFLVQDMLVSHGGLYSCGDNWTSHVVVDRQLVTGQNPGSSEDAATALLGLL